MALKGIKVIEIVNIPATSSVTDLLADFGATVYRIHRPGVRHNYDFLAEGKLDIELDITSENDFNKLYCLISTVDVLIESLRPGKMAKLGLSEEKLLKLNPRLIYVHYWGFGQTGPYVATSGHCPVFAANSGALPLLGGRRDTFSTVYPTALLTTGVSGPLCAFGILAALISRTSTGKGQVLDHATSEAVAYGASYLFAGQENEALYPGGDRMWGLELFETKDGRHMAVGIFERPYVDRLYRVLGLDPEEMHKLSDKEKFPLVEECFKTKNLSEWVKAFEGEDAGVMSVKTPTEAAVDQHNLARNVFSNVGGKIIPNPAPKLSDTPAVRQCLKSHLDIEKETEDLLRVIHGQNIQALL